MSTQIVNIQPLSQPVDLGVEPATFSPEVEAEIDRHLAKYPVMRSAILPLMFIVQRERGYLDPPGVAYLARRLRLRITDIWEVAGLPLSALDPNTVMQPDDVVDAALAGLDQHELVTLPSLEDANLWWQYVELRGRMFAAAQRSKPASRYIAR